MTKAKAKDVANKSAADKTNETDWPCWFYGPKGEAEVFEKAEDVPEGWEDHPTKFEAEALDL